MNTNALEKARDFLARTQNEDGGWGYRAGGISVTEPTAVAVVAQPSRTVWERGVSWLLHTQRDDGGWGVNGQDDASNWHSARAAWALQVAATEDALLAAHRGVQWLLKIPVVRVTDSADVQDIMGVLDIDPTLAGWPWQPREAPFVEPTSLGLLVLAAAGLTEHPRFLEGVAYLRDRVCQGGGWNVGNPYMFDKPLPPTPNSTALALLALLALPVTDADERDPLFSNGLKVLREILTERVAASSLAWGILALQSWDAEVTSLSERLLQMQSGEGGWADSPYATASAALALQGPDAVFARGS